MKRGLSLSCGNRPDRESTRRQDEGDCISSGEITCRLDLFEGSNERALDFEV